MKQYITLSITALCLFTTPTQGRSSIMLGIDAGVGSHVTPNAHYWPVGLMGNATLKAGWMFNSRIGVVTGIGTSAYNYVLYHSSANVNRGISGTPSLFLKYTDIPIMFRMENRGPESKSNLRFYVQGGVMFGFLLGADQGYPRGMIYKTNTRPCFGSGFNFALSPYSDLTMGCEISTSLRDESRDGSYANVPLTAYCLKFGAQFHLR